MTRLNKNAKKASSYVASYFYHADKNECSNVETFYKNPSNKKIKAWLYCKELCNKYNGLGLCITGGNSSFFSAGFIFNNDNKKYLCYITYTTNYCIELD